MIRITGNKIVDLETIPLYLQNDYATRNENIKNGKKLCKYCNGTGNELFSMYSKCPGCDGEGFVK